MVNSPVMAALPEAEAALQRFPDRTRMQGLDLHKAGCVYDVDYGEDFHEVWAFVQDSWELQVEAFYNESSRVWAARCDGQSKECRKGHCRHVAGLLHHYVDHVRSREAAATTASSLTLKGALKEKLSRELTWPECDFLAAVQALYRECDPKGAVTEGSLWNLGWTGKMPGYQRLSILPGRPESELEFWFGLVELARQRNYAIPPAFRDLQPTPEYEARIATARRAREVGEWQRRLENLPLPDVVSVEGGRTEIRFRIGDDKVIPEVRKEGADWKAVKSQHLSEFRRSVAPRLDPESVVLWESFEPVYSYSSAPLSEENLPLVRWLGVRLRLPGLAAFFVDAAGQPLPRHERPLQWRVTEPAGPEGDYEFALRDSDGNPPGRILLRIPGEPSLYLTSNGLFPGPGVLSREILSIPEARIPAEVLESKAGLRLLDLARVPVPPRLEQRIRTIPLRPRVMAGVRCDRGSAIEYCDLRITATSPDERYVQVLRLGCWEVEAEPSDEALVRLDRTDLGGIPGDVVLAGFKSGTDWDTYSARITKSFPERFVAFLASLPPTVELDLRDGLESFRDGSVSGSLQLEAEEAGPDWFDLKVVVSVQDTTLTPEEIRLLVAARGQWVKLAKRGWRRLEYRLTDQEEADLARIGLTPRQLSAEPQRLHALQLADPSSRRFLDTETAGVIERKAGELRARVAPELPSGIRAELRPYQRDGFHFLAYLTANRFGGILADDMGLGKTLQAITWLAWLRAEGATPDRRGWPSLVVCPKSVQDNWRAEAERFCPDLRVRVWTGATASDLNTAFSAADLHVLNYAQLRLASDLLVRTDFLAVILDEGQNIKTPSSQTAQVARQLRAEHRLVLTGTPIENRLLDLWSLMAFAMPGILGSRTGFGRLYDDKDDKNARLRLSARVRPFLLRRTKSQVARDLPDRAEEDLYCELEGEQKSLYRAELKAAQQHLLRIQTQSALNKDRFHLLTSLLRLRQICCHPRLLKPDSRQDGAKMEALLETLEPLLEEGEKVLVFSQFVELLSLLKPALDARGWTHWYLAGETENRGELVRRFQEHAGGGVFLISLKAGGAGLNLTAATYVVLFDPWWNPAVENQAIDRTHRIGQTRKIMAYRLLIKDSIEEKIRALQKSKHLLAEEVLGEERFSSSLTLEDLRFLLAD